MVLNAPWGSDGLADGANNADGLLWKNKAVMVLFERQDGFISRAKADGLFVMPGGDGPDPVCRAKAGPGPAEGEVGRSRQRLKGYQRMFWITQWRQRSFLARLHIPADDDKEFSWSKLKEVIQDIYQGGGMVQSQQENAPQWPTLALKGSEDRLEVVEEEEITEKGDIELPCDLWRIGEEKLGSVMILTVEKKGITVGEVKTMVEKSIPPVKQALAPLQNLHPRLFKLTLEESPPNPLLLQRLPHPLSTVSTLQSLRIVFLQGTST
ncbi:hypothetical protein H6P81_003271 [Aristolochia fimbriata]|uniref:Uncharacterized protein n=1 Tax=Aristolochia fimbriata TaxID=158543 RepID=A0AAV7FGI5_ARIFI|nr:hypothetical protein H6P81_003271 [Aristolochia fimbriata]